MAMGPRLLSILSLAREILGLETLAKNSFLFGATMNVTLLSCTPDAMNLLLRTKNTRLKFSSDPSTWTEEERQQHIEYMRDTIQSSWEFVSYTFQIEGVSRAFTHQLVRTRTGSYAQESQRTIDARENPVIKTPGVSISADADAYWELGTGAALESYAKLVDLGVAPQDARGLLPTNISTSIIAQFSLRTMSDMAKVRLCTRTAGEYQNVFRAMRALVIAEHPWAEDFINVQCVALGVCAFPRYGKVECPIYHPSMDQTEAKAIAKLNFARHRHEARPKAVGGKAQ